MIDMFSWWRNITTETHLKIMEQKSKTLSEKFNCFIKQISSMKSNSISYLDVNHCYLSEIGHNRENGFELFLKKLQQHNYIENLYYDREENHYDYTLTLDGLEYIETIESTNIDSKNIFCAFYFTDELQNIFDNTIKQTIESLNYTYSRVSSSTTNTNKKIDDEIISLIRSARIVIADFTGQRNSVYFEAGLAMGLNIPVIWTCKKDQVEQLSFDTRQYPHIIWEHEEELSKKIKDRIKAMP